MDKQSRNPDSTMITVIIVTFNSEKTIGRCLESLRSSRIHHEIIIVDNNSSDGTIKVLDAYAKDIQLIASKTNLGFGKACNKAVQNVTTPYLCFLNPDAYFSDPDGLQELLLTLQDNSEYGLIGPKLLFLDGSLQKSVRRLPTIWRAVKQYIFNQKTQYEFYVPESQALTWVESLVGACWVIRTDLFRQLHGFDEKYFMYFEDLDLCKRLLNLGYKIGFVPTVTVKHLLGGSGENMNTKVMAIESAKKFQGVLGYELIAIIGRIGNKLHLHES